MKKPFYQNLPFAHRARKDEQYLSVEMPTELFCAEKLAAVGSHSAALPAQSIQRNGRVEVLYPVTGLTSFARARDEGRLTTRQLWNLQALLIDVITSGSASQGTVVLDLDHLYLTPAGKARIVCLPLRGEEGQAIELAGFLDQLDACRRQAAALEAENSQEKSPRGEPIPPGDGLLRATTDSLAPEKPISTIPLWTDPLQSPPFEAKVEKTGPRLFEFGTVCDIGDVKPSNQDRVVVRVGSYKDINFGLFLVADGMGGLAHGEKASSLVSQQIVDWYNNSFIPALLQQDLQRVTRTLDQRIAEINSQIISFAGEIHEKVGTTLTLLLVVGGRYIIRHVGDSRIYYYDHQLTQMTQDHSFVAMEMARGRLTPEEAKNHPRRNVLTQCIGVRQDVDLFRAEGTLAQSGFALVCSDGFHNYFDWDRLREYLSLYNGGNLQQVVEYMRADIQPGCARDNVSCILAKIDLPKEG